MDRKLELLLKGNAFCNMVESFSADLRKRYGLKKNEIEVLFFLGCCSECNTPSKVASMTQMTRGHVSQAIDTLLDRNLITGVQDERDRRSVHYFVTDEAKVIVRELERSHDKMEERFFEGITSEERETLERIILKLSSNMEEIMKEM
ncbi:MAG: MarR family transcriptional regulator [Spirochaetales bacterium]|nr:MarR family transcriptional regulator [Spirochaetales bacterium]